MLPKEAVDQYRKIYKNAYHVDLNDDEATQMANDLFEFMQAVYLPADEEELITTNENEPSNSHQ